MGWSLAKSVEILREDELEASDRFVDLALSLRVCDVDNSVDPPRYDLSTDEVLVEIGGCWDRKEKKWAGHAREAIRIVRVPRNSDQEQPARWLAEWFTRYVRGGKGPHWKEPKTIPAPPLKGRAAVEFRRVWTWMLVGGRRGGKSHLAVVSLIMMMVAVPKSITWAVSPTQDETDELETAAREILPSRWFTARAAGAGRPLQFRLANESRLLFLSGHKPRSLKRGRVDLALLNEGQNMYRATWRQLRGAIADRAGLVIIACNPPDETIGQWIEEVYEQARARKVKVEPFHFVGRHNPFVTDEALEEMREEVDERTAAKEIDGKMGIPIGDKVFFAWSSTDSVRDVPPRFIDVTAEVTKRELGKAFGYVVGMDFQYTPHMAATVMKVFRDPDDPAEELLWVVDEVIIEKADEDGLLDGLESMPRWKRNDAGEVVRDDTDTYRGWFLPEDPAARPVCCAVVADASGFFQNGEHTKKRTSIEMLKARRWSWCFKPLKDSDKNPDVVERVRTTNARLKTADSPDGLTLGKRRLFSCRENLRTNVSMRDWEMKNGAPHRRSDHAHVCDCVSYVAYRFYGRPKVKRPPAKYEPLDRFGRGRQFAGM